MIDSLTIQTRKAAVYQSLFLFVQINNAFQLLTTFALSLHKV